MEQGRPGGPAHSDGFIGHAVAESHCALGVVGEGEGRRQKEGALRQSVDLAEGEPVCVVCEPWPPELRQTLREDIEAIPLRATVCEDCMRSWWQNLPWGPPLER
jgi:hypothetical protein